MFWLAMPIKRPTDRGWLVALLTLGVAIAAACAAAQTADDPVSRDRRLYAGTWQVTAIENDGEKSGEDDVKRLTVVNDDSGGWTLLRDGVEMVHGTSTIDAEALPKTIDFEITSDDGKGQLLLGIYEIGPRTRRLCLRPPGEWRPREFAAGTGTRSILMTFERLP
jgi:uncharacterized protein (TIGR03067 family)